MSKHTPGPATRPAHTSGKWLVWEPEFLSPSGGRAMRLVIGRSRGPREMMQEIAYVNCESSFFRGVRGNEQLPVKSELVNEAFAPAEAIANAKLIAAAPDLLKACEAVEDYVQTWGMEIGPAEERFLQLVAAAIAKATGEHA